VDRRIESVPLLFFTSRPMRVLVLSTLLVVALLVCYVQAESSEQSSEWVDEFHAPRPHHHRRHHPWDGEYRHKPLSAAEAQKKKLVGVTVHWGGEHETRPDARGHHQTPAHLRSPKRGSRHFKRPHVVPAHVLGAPALLEMDNQVDSEEEEPVIVHEDFDPRRKPISAAEAQKKKLVGVIVVDHEGNESRHPHKKHKKNNKNKKHKNLKKPHLVPAHVLGHPAL